MHGSTELFTPSRGSAIAPDERMAYRVPSVAKILDLSERMVWNLVRTGQIGSVRAGTARLVTRKSIERYLADLAEAPDAEAPDASAL